MQLIADYNYIYVCSPILDRKLRLEKKIGTLKLSINVTVKGLIGFI